MPSPTQLTVIGTIMAALIAAVIARGVALANLRQAWINALRDDLADFVSVVAQVRLISKNVADRNAGNMEIVFTSPDARRALELLDRMERLVARITLRLNPAEESHQELVKALNGYRDIKPLHTTEQLLDICKPVLKREWQVTKWGAATPVIDLFKWVWN